MTTLLEHNLKQAEAMSERVLQDRVLAMAKLYGWRAYHTHDSRRSNPGFPDLVLVNALTGRLLFVELKSHKGRVTKDQQAWLDDLDTVADKIQTDSTFDDSHRLQVDVWRPADLVTGEIAAVLGGVA